MKNLFVSLQILTTVSIFLIFIIFLKYTIDEPILQNFLILIPSVSCFFVAVFTSYFLIKGVHNSTLLIVNKIMLLFSSVFSILALSFFNFAFGARSWMDVAKALGAMFLDPRALVYTALVFLPVLTLIASCFSKIHNQNTGQKKKTEKPEIVNYAQVILWVTLAIGVVKSVMVFLKAASYGVNIGDGWFIYFVTPFTFAFKALLIYLLGKRKNWVRWLYVVLFVLLTPLSIHPLIQSLSYAPIQGIIGIIQIVAEIVAGVFLFLSPATAWYKNKPQQNKVMSNSNFSIEK